MGASIENKAVALVVIRAAVVAPDVEVVDRRAEEEFADVVS
jgi:hypothetical protein